MPELPEVEATRRYLLSADLVGRVITGADILWSGAIRSGPVETFVLGLTGRPILDIGRRAKLLLLRLGEGSNPSPATLAVHLRMTGALTVAPGSEARPAFTRNVFHLDDGREIRFLDPRKLGTLRLVDDEAELTAGLGPEPLDPSFTPRGPGGPARGPLRPHQGPAPRPVDRRRRREHLRRRGPVRGRDPPRPAGEAPLQGRPQVAPRRHRRNALSSDGGAGPAGANRPAAGGDIAGPGRATGATGGWTAMSR